MSGLLHSNEKMLVLLQTLERAGTITQENLVGCTEEEIRHLEVRLHLSLPEAYRIFLRTMGKQYGNFISAEFEADYLSILEITESERTCFQLRQQELETFHTSSSLADSESSFILPDNALIIGSRCRDQFHYILGDGGDDSPVYYYGWVDNLETVACVAPSLFDYWEMMRD